MAVQERTCLRCGTDFPRNERRYNAVPYRGYYCRECDGVDCHAVATETNSNESVREEP